MSSNVLAGICIGLIAVMGLLSIVVRRSKLLDELQTITEFNNRFVEFTRKTEFDDELYAWLTRRAIIIQALLGPFGVMEYQQPFANQIHHDYAVIINFLIHIRREMFSQLGSWVPDNRNMIEYANGIQEVLLRYYGVLENEIVSLGKQLRNPVVWFRQGVRVILSLPLRILGWFGILSERYVHQVMESGLLGGISGVVALIGFVSGVITIVIGWEQFQKIVFSTWARLTP